MKKTLAVMFAICFSMSFAITGCKNIGTVQQEEATQAGSIKEEGTTSINKTQKKEHKQEKIIVYTGNGNADGFLAEIEKVKEVTGKSVYEALKSQDIIPKNVEYQSFAVTEDNGKRVLTLDLSKEMQEDLMQMGSTGETLTMQAIANTYLVAYHGDQIIITADGKNIETGHMIYEDPMEFEVSIPENMEHMVPVFDSLMRCMLENNTGYTKEDASFYWNALFYLIGGYFDLNELCTVEGEEIKVPAPVVEQYANALFADSKGLFDIPKNKQGIVRYDKEEDAYYFPMGDIGLSDTRVIQCEAGEKEGSYIIYAQLFDSVDKNVIKTYRFVVKPNVHANKTTESMFDYSVDSVEEM